MRYNLTLCLLCLFCLQPHLLRAQRDAPIKDRAFQLSIAPALGTNGLHPGSFNNFFSLNLTAGYAASSLLLEIGTLSNLNVNHTRGLQIAGLTNITGGNAFAELNKKQRDEKIQGGFESYLSGIQLAGLTNIVAGNIHGAQFAGGMNLGRGALIGAQVSGIANLVYTYSFGVQLAGLFNVSAGSFSGVQVAALSNYTLGELEGVQIALLNQAGDIKGKNSYDLQYPTAVQIGLVNSAKKMNGFQIGLVNIAKRSQGTQIGLVNLYRNGKDVDTCDGTAIGLVNIGDMTYASVYASEIFALNYELSTGTMKNARKKSERRNVYVTNALIYSHASRLDNEWSLGYGLKKLYFNRSPVPLENESKFLGYGIDLQHVNLEKKKITRHLNLLTRLKVMAGRRLAPKLFGVNGFAALSLNTLISDTDEARSPKWMSATTKVKGLRLSYWPGLSLGVLLH